MALEFKDREQLVEDVIAAIQEKIEDIDFSEGEPLRTFIEAIMEELDKQYWQIEQTYTGSFVDTAYGEDLTNLVKLLGIERYLAKKSTGRVKFYRETPASLDYLIPAGTLVETLPDSDGNVIQFETTENVVMLTGTTIIYANIQSIIPGISSNVIANKIVVINNPPSGIESVANEESTIGGEEEETDENLRDRAKKALETAGAGTIPALLNKILNTAGIKSVKVLDMERGIGTVDVLVLGDLLPMPSTKLQEITKLAQDTKAGGIDIQLYEPTVVTVNLDITLILEEGYLLDDVISLVDNAIDNYFATLEIGESFIRNQLSKEILNNTENKVLDITINAPTANLIIGDKSIAVLGTKIIQ